MHFKTALVLFLAFTISAYSDDWTVGGKTYHNVTVGQVEADRVHITYDGGLGTVAFADLTPELQKRFNYDPDKVKAQAAMTTERKDLNPQATTIEPNFLTSWADKAEKESESATTEIQKLHAQTQQTRVQIFRNLLQSSTGPATNEFKHWMDCVMTDSICVGMPKILVMSAWGNPDSETADTDGFDMLTYGNYASVVSISNGVVKRITQTTVGGAQ